MTDIAYGKAWFRYHARIPIPYTEVEARDAHNKRKDYVAVFVGSDGCRRVVEVCDDYFGVEFLDSCNRSVASYQFQELEPSRLFLSMLTERQREKDTGRVCSGTTYFYQPDGRMATVSENFEAGNQWRFESTFDPASHWEPYPEFGEYESLARRKEER